MTDADEDPPQLSVQTLSILQEFYAEQESNQQNLLQAQQGNLEKFTPTEDWQLSQFWYDDATATRLAEEVIKAAGTNGRIAFVSSPTAYTKFQDLKYENQSGKCLEFDERFSVYGEDFVFYNFKEPLTLPEDLKNQFEVVIADPPFLSEDCLCKTAQTIRYLSKDKIIVCTGAVMEDLIDKLLGLKVQKFLPKHANGLQNEFRCFSNYATFLLDKH